MVHRFCSGNLPALLYMYMPIYLSCIDMMVVDGDHSQRCIDVWFWASHSVLLQVRGVKVHPDQGQVDVIALLLISIIVLLTIPA